MRSRTRSRRVGGLHQASLNTTHSRNQTHSLAPVVSLSADHSLQLFARHLRLLVVNPLVRDWHPGRCRVVRARRPLLHRNGPCIASEICLVVRLDRWLL